MKKNFCTYFDHRYISRGLTLYQSLVDNCSDAHLFALCLSDKCHNLLQGLNLPKLSLITLADFEKDDMDLARAKANRSLVEYYFTCTPSLPFYIFKNYHEVDSITYLDSDLYFFSDPSPLFYEIGSSSVAIIGHRFPPHLKHFEMYGKFNVCWMTFRKDANGLACLNWYRQKCNEWCYDRAESDRYADQKYLDYFHEKFDGVIELKHKGANLAPWNVANFRITYDGNSVRVDGQNLIFYHFHGLRHILGPLYDSGLKYSPKPHGLIRDILYTNYIMSLHRQQKLIGYSSLREGDIRATNTRHGLVQEKLPFLFSLFRKIKEMMRALKSGTCIICFTPR